MTVQSVVDKSIDTYMFLSSKQIGTLSVNVHNSWKKKTLNLSKGILFFIMVGYNNDKKYITCFIIYM